MATDRPQDIKGPSPRYQETDISHKHICNDLQKMRFYPSGLLPSDMSGIGFWIKNKDKVTSEIRVLDHGQKWMHIDTPDREIFLSGDHLQMDMDRPLDMGFDRFVSVSPTHKTSNDQIQDRFLINPHAFTSKVDKAFHLRAGKKEGTNHLVIADCFVANTLIPTEVGLVKIRELVGDIKGKTPYRNGIRVATPQEGLNLPRKRFRSQKPSKVITITTDLGDSVTCSYGQMFMTDGGWAKAEDLSLGDVVHRCFGHNVWSTENADITYGISDYLDKYTSEYPDTIECPYCSKTFEKLDSHVWFKHGISISKAMEENNLSHSMNKTTVQSFMSKKLIGKDISFPTIMTEDLAELLGYLTADGRLRFSDKNALFTLHFGVKKELAERAKNLIKRVFNINVKINKENPNREELKKKGRYVLPTEGVTYYSITLQEGRLFMDYLDFIGMKSVKGNNKEIPWSILQSTKDVVISYLVGLFSADGTIFKSGRPCIYTSSRRMTQQLQTVFNNLGVITKTKIKTKIKVPSGRYIKGYGASISMANAASVNNFNDLIELKMKSKNERQEIEFDSNHSNALLNEKKKNIHYTNKRKTKGLIGSRVTKIVRHTVKRVTYDLTMSHSKHSFLTNAGFVSHNSGGFQLRSGLTDFVDPEHLAEFYNDNVDEGMTLDIPCGGAPQNVVEACAQIQVYNSKYLKELVDKEVALSTVVHGIEIAEMKWYKNYIEQYDADFPIISIPSSMSLPPIKQLDRLAYLLSNGAQYSQYHLLGMFNIANTLLATRLIHKLAKAGREVFVTSDASSPYHYGVRREYLALTSHPQKKMFLGKKIVGGLITNPYRLLPCSCEVCSSIKYTDILTMMDKMQTQRLIIRHNEINYSQWLAMVNVYAHEMDDKQYMEYAMEMTGSALRAQVKGALDYIDLLLMDGWKAAHKRYFHLTGTMFGGMSHTMSGELTPLEPELHEKKERTTARLIKAVKRYQEYYK